jgi:hypothetical protein
MNAISRICPICNGIRGLRGMEKPGERLCLSSDACMLALVNELAAQPKEPTA